MIKYIDCALICDIRYEPRLGRVGTSDNAAHKYRVAAVDKISELDDVIAK